MMPLGYWTGMSQPPKSTILAPAATCCAWKGVRRSGGVVPASPLTGPTP